MSDLATQAPDPVPDEPRRPRPRHPEQTRRDIIDAAIAEFSDKGLSGARVDDIAARTRTTKRMIYYYFGSKEQLYAAVLEEMYGAIRDAEQDLRLEDLPPAEAMRRLVEVTFDYHAAHPEFVRLVSVENIHGARHIAGSPSVARRNAAVIGTIRAVLERGEREGIFRARVDPVDLHMLISAFCFHRVSNRHTLGVIFGRDLRAPEHAEAHRRMIIDAVLRYLRPDDAPGSIGLQPSTRMGNTPAPALPRPQGSAGAGTPAASAKAFPRVEEAEATATVPATPQAAIARKTS